MEREREEEDGKDTDEDWCDGAQVRSLPRLASLYKWNVPHWLTMRFQALTYPENCLVQMEYSAWIHHIQSPCPVQLSMLHTGLFIPNEPEGPALWYGFLHAPC